MVTFEEVLHGRPIGFSPVMHTLWVFLFHFYGQATWKIIVLGYYNHLILPLHYSDEELQMDY
jgi:hypothetical protein